jgi:hypothetical protein
MPGHTLPDGEAISPDVRVTVDLTALLRAVESVVERAVGRQMRLLAISDDDHPQLLYSERQAAERLGLTPTALKEERLKGRIDFLSRGRQVKYLPEHLVRYQTSWERTADQ